MRPTFLATSLLVLLLAGCAAPVPKYTLQNTTQPYAEIKSNIQGAYSRNESIQIYVMGDGGCGFFDFDHIDKQQLLFNIKNSNAEPKGYVKVAVDKPLRLRYLEETSGGGACEIMIEAKLDAGKKYSLNGGFQYKDGLIPILLGSRSCSLSMLNESENQPAEIKRKFKSTLCEK